MVFAVTLAAAAILPESRVIRLTPVCERKARTGRECPLCGNEGLFVWGLLNHQEPAWTHARAEIASADGLWKSRLADAASVSSSESATILKSPRPSRTTVGVTALAAAKAHVEITVTARK